MAASQFASTVIVLFEAQLVIAGAASTLTVTMNSQVGPSLLVQVTVVLPAWNVEPDGGLHVTVPQLPLVAGAE